MTPGVAHLEEIRMKRLSFVVPLMFTAALALSGPSLAQQAPAGSTGACKDGTYTSVDKKRGACSGHGGVKEWYGTTAKSAKGEANSAASESKSAKSEGKAAKATATASGAATAAAPAEHAQKTASVSRTPKGMRAEAAPGGGAGKVWVNTPTNVYHCSGDEWSGKTKSGEYMSEAQAKAKGAHAAHGKGCA
jgi:hypothetical protein